MTNFDEQPRRQVDDDERTHRQSIIRQRSIAGQEDRWRQADREELEYAAALNAPPLISEKKCHVCQSDYRLHIERLLIKGLSYSAIADSIPDGPDRRSISNHYKNHMPIDQALIRAIMEEEANLLNQNYEEGVKGAFSMRGAIGVMIRMGFEDVVNKVTTVEPKDMPKLIELYDKMDAASAQQMIEEARASITIFMEAIQNVVNDKLSREEAQEVLVSIQEEVKRLREQNDLEAHIEDNLRTLPRGE